MKPMKMYLFIFTCIFILSIPQLSGLPVENTGINDLNFQNSTQELTNANLLHIKNVESSGFGITVVLENQGQIDVENINVHIETFSNGFCIIPKKEYQVQRIAAGDQKEINIFMIGLGFGIVLDFPKFEIIVNSPDIQPIKMEIMANVIGPIVEVILTYLKDGSSYEGYTLFTPMWGTESYLISNSGEIVHDWTNSIYSDSQTSYLTEDGNLIKTTLVATSSFMAGGYQGRVEMYDWNDEPVWLFEYSTDQYCSHHDVCALPNGNVLIISWELKTAQEAIAAGKDPNVIQQSSFWPDKIIEVKPNGLYDGDIVWEWHAWDHIVQDLDPTKDNYGVVSEHPELININYGGRRSDWLHINSVDYNEKLDQIVLSSLHFDEIWVIDHSTTTEEAAGHTGGKYGKGGDLLYRWGNPQAYDIGDARDQKLSGQHDATWIPYDRPGGGNILVYNNGGGSQPNRFSTIDEINPPMNMEGFYFNQPGTAYGPKNPIWSYAENTEIYSGIMSGAQRLPNGNTIFCSAQQGYICEVTKEKDVVWSYTNPYPIGFFNKNVGKARRYEPTYPGLKYLFE